MEGDRTHCGCLFPPFTRWDKVRQWFHIPDDPDTQNHIRNSVKNYRPLEHTPGNSNSLDLEWRLKTCWFKKVSHVQPGL